MAGSIQSNAASVTGGVPGALLHEGIEFRLFGGEVPRRVTDPPHRADLLFRTQLTPVCYGDDWVEVRPEGGHAEASGRWTFFRAQALPEDIALLQGGREDLMIFDALGFPTRSIIAGMALDAIRLVVSFKSA